MFYISINGFSTGFTVELHQTLKDNNFPLQQGTECDNSKICFYSYMPVKIALKVSTYLQWFLMHK